MTLNSLEQKVEVLLAREQIAELRSRYNWYVARRQFDRLAELFLPDGVFAAKAGENFREAQGRQNIAAMLSEGPPGTFGITHNHTINVEGDEAWGTSVVTAHAPGPPPASWSGYYHEKFRRVDGKWYFSERRSYRYYPSFEDSGLDVDDKFQDVRP